MAVVGDAPATLTASYARVEVPLGLREGDLVLRAGRGLRADAVRLASAYRFTHVGLLAKSAAGWSVIHAAPPAGDVPGRVREEPLAVFARADMASDVLFAHSPVSAAVAHKAVLVARAAALRATPFDDDFRLDDAHAVYCTELVWRAYRAAGYSFGAKLTRVNVGVFSGAYMLPADLLTAGRFNPIESGS